MTAALLIVSLLAPGLAFAPDASAVPQVVWSVSAEPSCPTLHGESIENGSASVLIYVDWFSLGVVVIDSGEHYQLPLTASLEDDTPLHRVVVVDVLSGDTLLDVQQVQGICPTPSDPTILRNATAGNGSATLSWIAPDWDGGSDIVGYVVTPYIGYFPLTPVTFNSAATTQTVTGLNNGTRYRFRVQAFNTAGTGGFSRVTNQVTPTGMPIGDLPGWRQVFTDDFNIDVPLGQFPQAVSGRWGAYVEGWPDTSNNGYYSPSRVNSVHDGMLDWWIHSADGRHYVSVPYPLIPGASSANGMVSGRYAVRFRADPLPGYKTAWLLWPDFEVWPQDGEIDFPEGNLDGTIAGFVHHAFGTSPGDQVAFSTSATYPQWHTAVIEWTAGEQVTFMLDGRLVGTTTERVPSVSMHWVLQTETALDSIPADSTEGHVQVDWVAVWRPA